MIDYPPTAADRFADALASEFAALNARGRRILAVDSLARAGEFSAALAESLRVAGIRVFAASMEGFLRSAAVRSVRGDTGAAIYFDRYDVDALLRVLVEPFLLGGSAGFVPAIFDPARDREIEPVWLTGPADATLVIDGPFLQRPELRGRFHFVAYLDAGEPTDDAWAGAADLYSAQSQPRRNANAVVDYADPARPVRVFGDSC